jgi:tetratricopeptide (TPR) repeat protein
MAVSDQVRMRKKRKAVELLNKNRMAEAREVYLDLIKRNSADADVWFMLGTVEGRMNNIPAAEKAMGRALEIDATFAEAWLGMGQTLELQGRIEDAINHYLRALNIKPDLAEAHASLGRLYLALERFPQSVEHFRNAVKLGIDRPKLLFNYADALRNKGDLKEALAINEKLVVQFSQDAMLHYRLGDIYVALSDLDRAQQHFATAIKYDPENVAALTGEVMVLRMQKKFDEALDKIRPLFEGMQDNLTIALSFAELCRRENDCGRVIQRLESLVSSGTISPQGMAMAGFKLGKLYDAQGNYDKAFSWYRQANDLKKGGYNAGAADSLVNAIIAGYGKERMAAAARAGHSDKRPVFIVGMPRSGSSLIEQILASHPDVYGGGELTDMGDLLRKARGGRQDMDLIVSEVEHFTSDGLNQLAAKYSAQLDEISSGERIVTDKMLNNFFRLGFISLLFPDARIIHSRRDPLDTCLSCYFHNFASAHPYTNDFDSLVNYYHNYRRLMQHWREALSLPILDVDYEKLVADQGGETRRMIDFLGLDWDDRCLQYYKNKRVAVTASSAQVQQPIYQGSVGRWKHYEKYLAPLKAVLA